jgi:serine/threonine protein kinase
VLEPIREGPDLTLYRGRQHADPSPVLAVALDAEQPSPQGLRRLEHEYSLAAELDPAWAAKPLALTRHEGRTILVLKDPGGEPLDRVLERDHAQPLNLTRVLCIAIGLAKTVGRVHRRGPIHKDIKRQPEAVPGPVSEQSPCAAHSPRKICRHRNNRIRAQAVPV